MLFLVEGNAPEAVSKHEGNTPSFPYRVSLRGNDGALASTSNSDYPVEKIAPTAHNMLALSQKHRLVIKLR